jgi:hypothetical protein
MQILRERQERREAGMERHRQELEERAAVLAEAKARVAAEIEEERLRNKAARSFREALKVISKELFSHAS